MPAAILPICRASSGLALANSSSRRILRAIVSPSTRIMMKPRPSSSAGVNTCITRGDGRPASCASCISTASPSRSTPREGEGDAA
jgi:hypothetical protein